MKTMVICLAFLVQSLLLFVPAIFANPNRIPVGPSKPYEPFPCLEGLVPSLYQRGAEVTILESTCMGEGFVRADGRIVIYWTYQDDDRQWVGLYTICPRSGNLIGQWGPVSGVWFGVGGKLDGEVYLDTITLSEPRKEVER